MVKIKVFTKKCRYKSKESQPTPGSYATSLVWEGALPPSPPALRASTRWFFLDFIKSSQPEGQAKKASGLCGLQWKYWLSGKIKFWRLS